MKKSTLNLVLSLANRGDKIDSGYDAVIASLKPNTSDEVIHISDATEASVVGPIRALMPRANNYHVYISIGQGTAIELLLNQIALVYDLLKKRMKSEVKFFLVKPDDIVREIKFVSMTMIATLNKQFVLPSEMAVSNIDMAYMDGAEDLVAIVSTIGDVYDIDITDTEVKTERLVKVFLLDDGLDPYITNEYNHFCNMYKNVSIRPLSPGCTEIEFLRYSPDLDSFIRGLTDNKFEYNTDSDYYSDLLKGGWVTAEGKPRKDTVADETYQVLQPTEKALKYVRENTGRKKVGNSCSKGDVIIDILTGKKYQVMGLEYTSGIFTLMTEESQLDHYNPYVENFMYETTREEAKAFKDKFK